MEMTFFFKRVKSERAEWEKEGEQNRAYWHLFVIPAALGRFKVNLYCVSSYQIPYYPY